MGSPHPTCEVPRRDSSVLSPGFSWQGGDQDPGTDNLRDLWDVALGLAGTVVTARHVTSGRLSSQQ